MALVYKAQFFGAISTDMNKKVWKVWAHPKYQDICLARD
jgi:hypothetical protein